MQQLQYQSVISSERENEWSVSFVNTDHTIICSLSMTGEGAHLRGLQFLPVLQSWQVQTALEFHQLLQEFITSVTSKEHTLSLAAGCFVEGKCYLAAYKGNVVLRRHHKAGVLVKSDADLQLLEGKTQPEDVFVFATQTGANLLETVWQPLNQDLAVGDLQELLYAEMARNEVVKNGVAITFVTNIVQVAPEKGGQEGEEQAKSSSAALPAKLQSFPNLLRNLKSAGVKLQFWLNQQRQMYFSGDIYLRKQHTKKLVRVLVPVGMLIVVIIGGLLVRQSRISAQLRAVDQTLQPFESRLTELKAANKDNPLETRTKAQQLITELQDVAQKFATQPAAAKKVTATLTSAQSFYESISGQQEFPALPVFFDLKPTQSDFITASADLENTVAVFLDPGLKKMIALNLETKQPSLISLSEDLSPKAFSFDGKTVIALSNGIQQFPLSDSQKVKELRASEDANANAKFLESYGDYLYVFNAEKKNIFRYLAASGSANLSDPAGWVKAGTDIDFDNVQSMAIDGNIWLGYKDGKLQKLLSGKTEDFTVTGLKDPFNSPLTVYTKDGLDNLYVLEPQQSRVVVLTKKGEFLKEIKSQSLASASSLIVDEKLKKAFAVSSSLIFEISL